jgi:eukaryotic-like serine/threonine-protein kinase
MTETTRHPEKPAGAGRTSESWERCCRRFRDACHAGSVPSARAIREWLELVEPRERSDLLWDLVTEHLWWGWESGPTPLLEEYVAEFGAEYEALGSMQTLPAELAGEEFGARHAFPSTSDRPALDDYERRFGGRRDVAEILRSRSLGGGRYILTQFLGEGGLGSVWEAYDRELGRQVAIKAPRDGTCGHPAARERFGHEARITAGLDHPAIVTVHEHRADDRRGSFYVMRLVRGRRLTEIIAEYHAGRSTFGPGDDVVLRNELLRHFVAICQAIAYAHRCGVIHRDLKPDNVVVGASGEAVVLDWGLARRAGDAGESVSPDGRAEGTDAFMPPEQARGLADGRTDIFALGAILYAILTGRPPYVPMRGEDASAYRERIARAGYRVPHSLNRSIPRDLEAVCLRAMAPDPRLRYRSASELAADVARFEADEPVEARRPNHRERLLRWARRHPRAAAAVASALVVAAVLVGLYLADAHARRTRNNAIAAGLIAQAEELESASGAATSPEARDATTIALGIEKTQGALALLDLAQGNSALRARGRDLLARLRDEQRDVRAIGILEAARLAGSVIRGGAYDDAPMHRGFVEGFRTVGVDIVEGPVAEVVERVQSSRIRGPLIDAILEWSISRPDEDTIRRGGASESLVRRFWDVAAGAGADDLSLRICRAAMAKDSISLNELVARIDPDREPIGTMHLVLRAASYCDLSAVLPNLEAFRRRYPSDFWIAHNLARVYATKKDPRFDRAIAGYRVAIAANPRSAGAHNNLALALFDAAEGDEAIAEFREALRLQPELAACHYNLGVALRATRDVVGSETEFREAVRLDPLDAESRLNLGAVLSDQGKWTDAVATLVRASQLNPNLAEAHYNLGKARMAMQDLQGAIADFRQAVRIKPDHAEAHLGLALSLYGCGQFPEAVRKFRAAFEARPALIAEPRTQIRNLAACAAAMAGDDPGGEAQPMDKATLAAFRRSAADWLRQDLAAWGKILEKPTPQDRADAAVAVEQWTREPRLTAIREPAMMARLPEAERAALGALWADVATMIQKARKPR